MTKHCALLLALAPLAGSMRHAPRAIATRRTLLAGGPALLALVPGAAVADPPLLSNVQGPLQDAVAPGHWLGQFVGLNSRTEQWDFPAATPSEVSAALVAVLEELTPERRARLLIPEFKVQRADSKNVHVLTWTKAEWLDSLDVRLAPQRAGTAAAASFYATGFFPTSVPLAPLLNVGMAWLPFASPGPRSEMLQEFRLRALKGLLDKKLAQLEVGPGGGCPVLLAVRDKQAK